MVYIINYNNNNNYYYYLKIPLLQLSFMLSLAVNHFKSIYDHLHFHCQLCSA